MWKGRGISFYNALYIVWAILRSIDFICIYFKSQRKLKEYNLNIGTQVLKILNI